jgi:small subunit ribosomal protein S1
LPTPIVPDRNASSLFEGVNIVSEDVINEEGAEDESFADLFESYSAGMNEDVQIGDKIQGEIISIGKDAVFVDTGTKIDGVVDKTELLDENLELPCKVGEILELYVVSRSGSEIRLSKALSGVGGIHILGEAFESAVPVEGKVKGTCKGGFQVEILQKRAFCPISQIDLRYVEKPDDYVGETYSFLITQLEENGRNIVVSRRELLQREQAKARSEFLEGLVIGTQFEGRVTKLMPYGAFVELQPGVEGMVHLSELGWSRVAKAEDVLSTGDLATVKVISVEPGKKPGQVKIALSIKQLTEDPWNSAQDAFRIGDKIRGKVTRCVKFGAFVEIAPGIEGLVHISEMSYRQRVLKSEDVVAEGETVEVMIKEIDVAKRRISLSMKEAEGDPWVGIRDRIKVGQSVEGTIEKKEKFGYFVQLEPGITGLLPKSKISNSENPASIEKLRERDRITLVVEEIRPEERRMTLRPGDSAGEDEWRSYTKAEEKSIGSLGEKLQKALKSKT